MSEFTVVVAFFLAKLLDPPIILIAILGTAGTFFWGRTWPSIIISCVLAAVVQEWLLHAHPYTQILRPVMLLIAFAAALVWALVTLAVGKLLTRARKAV
jgi:hypothetical protein